MLLWSLSFPAKTTLIWRFFFSNHYLLFFSRQITGSKPISWLFELSLRDWPWSSVQNKSWEAGAKQLRVNWDTEANVAHYDRIFKILSQIYQVFLPSTISMYCFIRNTFTLVARIRVQSWINVWVGYRDDQLYRTVLFQQRSILTFLT